MKGDPIADIVSNMSAEQRARAGYEHLLDLSTDEDVRKVLSYYKRARKSFTSNALVKH